MRARRRYHYYDDYAESYDEIVNPTAVIFYMIKILKDHVYLDYRTYPIKINWPEIENQDSNACNKLIL